MPKGFIRPKPGVLSIESASARPSNGVPADGPAGHRIDFSYQDCGFGHVYTHTHDPVMGMVHQPLPLPCSPVHAKYVHVESAQGVDSSKIPTNCNYGARVPLGKLPKVNFPKFEGEIPSYANQINFILFFCKFYTILHFAEFYRTHYFKFLNYILANFFEMDSNFFYFKFLKNSNLTDRFSINR
jgi:hypothetical protein